VCVRETEGLAYEGLHRTLEQKRLEENHFRPMYAGANMGHPSRATESVREPKGKPQIPPLRYAPDGMTDFFGNYGLKNGCRNRESEGKSSGIPHLAKNERDAGHPSFVREQEPDHSGTEFVSSHANSIAGR
jgi:hypothetical protein